MDHGLLMNDASLSGIDSERESVENGRVAEMAERYLPELDAAHAITIERRRMGGDLPGEPIKTPTCAR